MPDSKLYFAYGSNLNLRQMRSRCPSAVAVRRATLHGYALAFGGYSYVWRGAVASIKPVFGGRVEGLLYRLDPADFERLDRFEGCPTSYVRLRKRVLCDDDKRRSAHVYVQTARAFGDERQRLPSRAYFNQIVREYDRHGFDLNALAAAVGVTL